MTTTSSGDDVGEDFFILADAPAPRSAGASSDTEALDVVELEPGDPFRLVTKTGRARHAPSGRARLVFTARREVLLPYALCGAVCMPPNEEHPAHGPRCRRCAALAETG